MLASNSGPLLRREGLAKEERRSLLTPARLSDRKAWPRRHDARFRLRPASLTGRPGQEEDDARFRLRPGIHRTSTYSSSLTSAVGANWDTTEQGCPLSKDPKN